MSPLLPAIETLRRVAHVWSQARESCQICLTNLRGLAITPVMHGCIISCNAILAVGVAKCGPEDRITAGVSLGRLRFHVPTQDGLMLMSRSLAPKPSLTIVAQLV